MIFVQLVGVLAFIFLFASYLMKNKDEILIFQIIAYLIFCMHYLVLGAFTGSLMDLVCAVSSFLNCKKIKNKKNYAIFLSVVILVVGIISFDKWYSIIPVITCLATSLLLIYGNSKVIRLAGLIAAFGWGLYSYFVGSYSGFYTNIFLFIFVIFSSYLRRNYEG